MFITIFYCIYMCFINKKAYLIYVITQFYLKAYWMCMCNDWDKSAAVAFVMKFRTWLFEIWFQVNNETSLMSCKTVLDYYLYL